MSDELDGYDEADFEPEFGVVCGEDVDAVLGGDEAAIRAWASGVLSTALDRVLTGGAEAKDLFGIAIETLWQFSGGEAGGSEDSSLKKWLDAEHPRGRQWSKFAEMVPAFIQDMNTMWGSSAEKSQLKPISSDDVPF